MKVGDDYNVTVLTTVYSEDSEGHVDDNVYSYKAGDMTKVTI